MAECLMGAETEYAINGMRGEEAVDRSMIVRCLMELAHGTLPHLRDESSSGLFLENAARVYLDCGLHIEFSTPECANPWDAVRYIEAGHGTMLDLMQKFTSGHGRGVDIGCYRVNVDYSGQGTTWGCHESYLHRTPPERLPVHLIPHLVSRTVYTGAGGFAPLSAGLRFTLSPRAAHMQQTISGDSTSARGIFHTKQEPLCAGYHRLHVLCGENLCSHLAMLVKFGATSLIVAMADAGLRPGEDVQLVSPLAALQTVASDVTCQEPLRVKGSPGMTAVAIQRRYLALAEAHLDDSFMPAWAPIICGHWRRLLDLLEAGPYAVSKVLDWAIKLSLYSNHASRCGLNWDRLPFWADVVDRMREALDLPSGDDPFPLDWVLGPNTPIPDVVNHFEGLLRAKGLQWDELRQVFALRPDFLSLDTRFGQLGRQGVFTQLDEADVLAHRVPGVDNIEHARANPPSTGRARLRGSVVKRVAGHTEGDWKCDWQRISSRKYGRICDLSDPFAEAEIWYDAPSGRERIPDNDFDEGPF